MSKRDERLWEVAMNIYRQLYREATPSADFDAMIKSGEAQKPQFFMKYCLSDERTAQIIEAHCRRNKLDKHAAGKVSMTVMLGSCPTSVIKDTGSETTDGDAKIRIFWDEWGKMHRDGDSVGMESHVSKMLLCNLPKNETLSPNIIAGLLNGYFEDLANHLETRDPKDLSTQNIEKGKGGIRGRRRG